MTPHTRPETTPAPDVVVPTSDLTPAEAWEVLVEGNRRFVAGEPSHPNQNAERRSDPVSYTHLTLPTILRV